MRMMGPFLGDDPAASTNQRVAEQQRASLVKIEQDPKEKSPFLKKVKKKCAVYKWKYIFNEVRVQGKGGKRKSTTHTYTHKHTVPRFSLELFCNNYHLSLDIPWEDWTNGNASTDSIECPLLIAWEGRIARFCTKCEY